MWTQVGQMAVSEGLTGTAILEAARALAPRIRADADEIERGRRLPLPLVRALQAAGVFRMPIPRAWGGPEADPIMQIRIIEELSAADPSVGWCVMIGADAGYFTAFLEDGVGRALYPDLDMVTAASARPAGNAEAVDGGYRVTGRWPFASGCQHASYIVANCFVTEGGTRRLMPDGTPETRFCYLTPDQCEIIDTWTTTGLRGSGSNDFAARDAFVRAEHTLNVMTSPILRDGPLYALPHMFIINGAGVPLGTARAAIDAVVALASQKQTRAGTGLRDEAWVRTAVARADALLGGARGYVFDAVGDLWEALERGDPPSLRQRARFRLALADVGQKCTEVVDLMYQTGGGSSVYATSPLDRLLRDAHTMNQHMVHSPSVFEVAGGMLLGLEPSQPMY